MVKIRVLFIAKYLLEGIQVKLSRSFAIMLAPLLVPMHMMAQNPDRASQIPTMVKRANFHQALEPDSQIIIGAGQANMQSFTAFEAATEPNVRPGMYMSYVGVKGFKSDNSLKSLAVQFAKRKDPPIIQLGVSMTKDGTPTEHYEHDVSAGLYDPQLDTLVLTMMRSGLTYLVRIGYEFNGHWNGYQAQEYKIAYKYVADKLRKGMPPERLALAWCYSADGRDTAFAKYYPGDDYVDWWAIDIFNQKDFTKKKVMDFADSSLKHRKPLLIGECTPRRFDLGKDTSAWRQWFVPFLTFIHQQPNLKAISYIYWDWSRTQWPDWGDGRFGLNPDLRTKLVTEWSRKEYQH